MDTQTWNLLLNLAGIALGGGALGVVLTHFRGVKGLDQADVADIRSHYKSELAAMRDRDEKRDAAMRDLERHWREMIKLADDRYNECQRERNELSDEVSTVKRELEGVKAQIRAQATDRVLVMEENGDKPSEVAPHSLAAAKRLKVKMKEGQSDMLNTAEDAVEDAKQTLVSTKETCEEVKRSEDGNGK